MRFSTSYRGQETDRRAEKKGKRENRREEQGITGRLSTGGERDHFISCCLLLLPRLVSLGEMLICQRTQERAVAQK